jgi:hypothetical protein
MADYLREHSEIFVPIEKEFFYFGAQSAKVSNPMTEERYLRSFEPWGSEKYAMDATPFYLYEKSSLLEIKALNNNAKIIIMLRSLADLLFSLYSEMKFSGAEKATTFNEAITRSEETKALGTNYFKMGRFTEGVKLCYEIFKAENVHIVIFDDLKKDTASEINKVVAFLNLSVHLPNVIGPSNPNKKAVFPRLNHFLQNPPAWMGAFLGVFFSHQFRFKVRRFLRSLNTIKVEKDIMNENDKKRINAIFEEDIAGLGQIINRDLSHWVDKK